MEAKNARPDLGEARTAEEEHHDHFTLHLSLSDGPASNTRLRAWTGDLDAFEDLLSKPQPGSKDGSYFVRGPFNGTATRADEHTTKAFVAILDGDKRIDPETGELFEGAPAPEIVHEALTDAGISHLIFTSHSHQDPSRGGPGFHRWRCVVPVELANAEELRAVVDRLLRILHQRQVMLAPATENYRWSQAWFLPRLRSPDAPYLLLRYDEGEPLDVASIVTTYRARSVVEAPEIPTEPRHDKTGIDTTPIGRFCALHGDAAAIIHRLESHGYVPKHTCTLNGEAAYRLIRPRSTSGIPGVTVYRHKDGCKWLTCSHHGEDDPLAGTDGRALAHDAFDVFRILECGGDEREAFKRLRQDHPECFESAAEDFAETVDANETGPEGDDATILRLALLSPFEYDRCREAEAQALGIRVGTLDRLVVAQRKEASGGEPAGRAFEITDEDPYPDPVDGELLLAEVVATIRRFAVVPDGAALAIASWIVGTYVYDEFALFPKLLITSPEKRCGKSTLAAIIGALVARALPCSNVTAAALFRCIEKWKPTLLLDEADTFIRDNEELRGIVNAGHTRASAYVIRLCGDDHEPRQFSVWAPMLIAMIRLPADTIVDRSVVVQMRRKMPGETVCKLPVSFREDCRVIRQKLTRWAADHSGAIEQSPAVPAHSNDRTCDNWTPLFAIANAIGGAWPDRLKKSFALLNADDQDEAIGPRILADIRQIFRDKGIDRIHSDDLITALGELDESPWSEWNRGKPITQNSLARLLKPFKVYSERIRIDYNNKRGYHEAQFQDAFARYLSDTPSASGTLEQPSNGAAFSDFQSGTQKTRDTGSGTRKPSDYGACSTVPDEEGEFRRHATNDRAEAPLIHAGNVTAKTGELGEVSL